jgi:membrane-associated phospholipid phosphatase
VESDPLLVRRGGLSVQHLLGLAFVAAMLLFVAIAGNVFGGNLMALDLAVAGVIAEVRSPAGERFLTVVSWLGSREALAIAALTVAGWLWLSGRRLLAAGWLAAQAGGGLLNVALKETFARTRPEFADPLLAASSWSFPSAHAMCTFILCGLGAYLLLRQGPGLMAAGTVVALTLLWCVLMAFSRLYLGVHYVTDVIAGIIAGAAWVAACASALERLLRRDTQAAP